MPKKKGIKKKLQVGDTFTVRLPENISPELLEKLQTLDNRNQTILDILELVLVRANLPTDMIVLMLAGSENSKEISISVSNAQRQEAKVEEKEKKNNIFKNTANEFKNLIKN